MENIRVNNNTDYENDQFLGICKFCLEAAIIDDIEVCIHCIK